MATDVNPLTGLGSRLRILEERYTNLRKKSQMMDRNELDFEKDARQEIKALSADILEVKRSLAELNEKIDDMAAELSSTAKVSDLKMLETYINIWDPTQFVRREDIKKQ